MSALLIQTYRGVHNTARHLLLRLWQSPLLLGWLVIGAIVAFAAKGFSGVVQSFANLLLIGIYAVIIKLMTEGKEPPKQKIKMPEAELPAGILFAALSIFLSFLFFNIAKVPVVSGAFNSFLNWLYSGVGSLAGAGFPEWSISPLSNAVYCTIVELVPVLIIYAAFGYKLRGMGLKPGFWPLTFTLLGISVLMGLPVPQLHEAPIHRVVVLYFIQLFINGLPEELFYRGFLLPRFEAALGNPINALAVTSVIFNAAHIPFSIAHGSGIPSAILDVFSISYPSGLIWGYLYLRTRSIVPGMLWHAANGILGGFLIYFG